MDGTPADGRIQLDRLAELLQPPEPWAPGEPHFWDDPHISAQMLVAHLDPTTNAASRPPQVIDASVEWIVDRLGLRAGDSLIDLGCGPGLYTRRFAARGLQVTGIDLSARSVEHARSVDPHTTYRREDYLALDDRGAYDVSTLIYGDYCTFDDVRRATLLNRARSALRPGGWFVLDVTTAAHHRAHNCGDGWSVSTGGGFWKASPYVLLSRHFTYPDLDLVADQYTVVEADGTLTVYRNWFRHFTAEAITAELKAGGFTVDSLHGDLTGARYDPAAHWIGVVTRRA